MVFNKTNRSGQRYSTPRKSSPIHSKKRESNNRIMKNNLFENQLSARTTSRFSSENSDKKPLPYFQYSRNREISSFELENKSPQSQSFIRPSDVTLRDLVISGVLSDRISLVESESNASEHPFSHSKVELDQSKKKSVVQHVDVDASKRHSFARIIKPDMKIHKFESESIKHSLDYMKQLME